MKRVVLVFPVIASFLFFHACTHKPQVPTPVVKKDSTNTTTTTTTTTTTQDTTAEIADTSVCFQRDVLPIFTGSCAMSGCHDAITVKSGYNLTSYATIKIKGLVPGSSASSKLYTECTKGKMPVAPIPKLDSTQLSFIRRWIDKGAPNDTNCSVTCDTTKFTYASAIAPILSKYCYSCHAVAPAVSSGGGIVLDNYNSLLIQAQNGKLLGDIGHSTGFNAMPLGGSQLLDCKITQIRKWIEAGAQNN